MIDVEAGKEDLFSRLTNKLNQLNTPELQEKMKILYLARCFTHSDISIMVDVKDENFLPEFITREILTMDGVFDMRTIHLFSPNFFKIPKAVDVKTTKHFTVTLDIKSDKTQVVFNYLRDFAATEEAAISFMAYSFFSYENDIILTLLAPDIESAGKFVQEKIRPIEGVIDSVLWQIESWELIIDHIEFLDYINYYRIEDMISEELIDDTYICAC
jgi:DNA-binding Lrp family transcriptional regulator